MPRIAAALAVLLTVVTCIGFNTARYPMVWDMVAGSGDLTQSRQSEESAAFSQSTAAPQSATVARISAYPIDGASGELRVESGEAIATEGAPIAAGEWGPIESVARRLAPEKADFGKDPVAPEACPKRPVEASASAKYASSPVDAAALVPVKSPYAGREISAKIGAGSSTSSSAVAGADDRKPTSKTRRLPPVDAVTSVAGADSRPPRLDDSIPIYPTTGIQ